MLQGFSNLNWVGVLLAFLAYFFLGAVWFAALFSKPYRISLGKGNEPPPPMGLIFLIGPAICTLVVTITVAFLIAALNITSYADALLFSLVIGTGFLVANTFNIAINPNIPRPLLYGIISGAYHLVGIATATMILTAMKK